MAGASAASRSSCTAGRRLLCRTRRASPSRPPLRFETRTPNATLCELVRHGARLLDMPAQPGRPRAHCETVAGGASWATTATEGGRLEARGRGDAECVGCQVTRVEAATQHEVSQ